MAEDKRSVVVNVDFKKLPRETYLSIAKMMQKSLQQVKSSARNMAPVKTGDLKKKIHKGVKKKTQDISGFVNSQVKYGKVVEYGGLGKGNVGGGKNNKRIHRDYKAHPYLMPSFAKFSGQFQTDLQSELSKEVEKENKK